MKVAVLMGVSGCGKTTVGKLLAKSLNCRFYDGDDYHPVSNREKMRLGTPLEDSDRTPWLATLNRLIKATIEERKMAVLACSALKEKYREVLLADLDKNGRDEVGFFYLKGERDLLANRLSLRTHEYMNPHLLDSQLATLEEPGEDNAHYLDTRLDPQALVAMIVAVMSVHQ